MRAINKLTLVFIAAWRFALLLTTLCIINPASVLSEGRQPWTFPILGMVMSDGGSKVSAFQYRESPDLPGKLFAIVVPNPRDGGSRSSGAGLSSRIATRTSATPFDSKQDAWNPNPISVATYDLGLPISSKEIAILFDSPIKDVTVEAVDHGVMLRREADSWSLYYLVSHEGAHYILKHSRNGKCTGRYDYYLYFGYDVEAASTDLFTSLQCGRDFLAEMN